MKVTPAIIQDEFIGLKAKIVRSLNPNYVGISGMVIDETRNTFTILSKDKEKVIIKDGSIFHFTLPNRSILEIDGEVLIGRPEDRVKRTSKRRW